MSVIIYSLTNTAAVLIAAALDPRIQLGTSDR
jgi:hypothetical protein